MKGANMHCRCCGSADLKVNRASETIQCEGCERILEERYNDSRIHAVNIQQESPFCVVTNDVLARHKFDDKLEGDPFYGSGFITAFSHLTVEQQCAFTLTARTYPGDLADLERILADLDLDGRLTEHLPDTPSPTEAYFKDKATPAPASVATRTNAEAERDVDARPDSDDTSTTQSHPSKLPHILAAYFALQDAILVLPVSREAVDEAMRVFYTYCIAAPGLRLKDVEPFAMAALVVAVRSTPSGHAEPDLADLAAAACMTETVLSEAVALVLPVVHAHGEAPESASGTHSSRLVHYCCLLGLSSQVQAVAIQISENALAHRICGQRNPRSVAGASIYLASHLEDQGTTQTEISKVTGFTEVSLRKAYKELLLQHQTVLPATYVPKVRVETLLSGVVGSLSLAPVSSPERKLPHASSMLPCGTGAAAAAAVSVKLEPQAQAFGAGGQSGDGDRDVV